jgi:hypothetical protein
MRIERLAHGPGKPNLPLYHTPAILSREILYKIAGYFFPYLVQYYQLTFCMVYGILLVSRGKGNIREHTPPSLEKSVKSLLTNRT